LKESSEIARKRAIVALEIQTILDERSAELSEEERSRRVRIAVEPIATYISASRSVFGEYFLELTSCCSDMQLVANKRIRSLQRRLPPSGFGPIVVWNIDPVAILSMNRQVREEDLGTSHE
jgi:hypothetical protein